MLKGRISKILGVVLTLSLLASFIVAAVPASAGTLSWTTYTLPSTSNNVLTTNTTYEVAVASDGKTIFAASGPAQYVYKSTDRGVTWSTIMTTATTNTDRPYLIAVSPDDANYIVTADTVDYSVRVTTNGGTTWAALTAITGVASVTDIDFSPVLSGVHYIAVSGTNTGGFGDVWYFDVGAAAPTWIQMSTKAGFSTTSTTLTDNCTTVAAVEFSPGFSSDQVLTAVTANATVGVGLQLFSFNSKKWNVAAGFASYPATVVADTALASVTKASITLAPDYLASDDSLRLAYVGLDITTAAKDGIYRMSDTTAKALKEGVAINSVAYNGSVLVAGRYDSNIVYYSSDATATTPTVSTTASYKRPGYGNGTDKVVVAWAGTDVVASTQGNEGGFSVSKNNAKSFNDISLIQTTITNVSDIVGAADNTKIYAATNDGVDVSVWRKTTAWERVICLPATLNYLLHIAPDNSDILYLAEKAGTNMYYTADAGETRWQIRTSGVTIQDVAVEGTGEVLYAISAADGKVAKSTNNGFTWASAKNTNLSTGATLTSLGKDLLIAGSSDGYVAYSTDGNSTWTKISTQIANGNVQVAASGLAANAYIYTATSLTNDYIYRWQIGQSSTSWTKIYSTAMTNSYAAKGMVLNNNNLYVITDNGTDSKLFRTLNPTLSPTVFWSTVDSTSVFSSTPSSLKLTTASTGPILWAIDTEPASDLVKSYGDTLATAASAPKQVGPKQDFVVGINPISGLTYDVTFSWNRPSDEVTGYRLQVANDQGFDEVVKEINISETGTPIAAVLGHTATNAFDFQPGATYFWRVRVQTPITGQWSAVQRVTVANATTSPPVSVTVPPAPVISITIPPAPTINIPPAPTPAPAPAPVVPAFIWAIIIIGAVLVIALIVLIVRTRRVP